MKKIIIALCAVSVLLLSGYFYNIVEFNQVNEQINEESLRITAIIPHDDTGYWGILRAGLENRAEELEISLKVEIPYSNYDEDQITELVKKSILTKPDYLILPAIEDIGFKSTLENANELGVKIIFVDSDMKDFPDHLYVGTDNYALGLKLGECLLNNVKIANVAIMSAIPEAKNLNGRIKGIEDIIKNTGISIVDTKYDNYTSLNFYHNYLEVLDDDNIDTMVAVEGVPGIAISNKIERDEKFKYILGMDLNEDSLKALNNGNVDGLVIQEPYKMGAICIDEAINHYKNGDYSNNVIYTTATYITKEDLNANGEYIYE